jgi:hypothetical protein
MITCGRNVKPMPTNANATWRAHSRTQRPSYARSTERDEGLWPNPYQTGIWLATTKVIVLITYISFTMFLWFPVLDLARAPRRPARKKGSGYENALRSRVRFPVRNFLTVTRTQSSCEKRKSQRSAESRGFSPGTPCFLPQGKLTGWVRHIGQGADH